LYEAVWRDAAPLVDTLLALGANATVADSAGYTPLHLASSSDGAHALDNAIQLSKNGAAIDVQDKRGLTPLHYAFACGNDLVAHQLVVIGADPRCAPSVSDLASSASSASSDRHKTRQTALLAVAAASVRAMLLEKRGRVPLVSEKLADACFGIVSASERASQPASEAALREKQPFGEKQSSGQQSNPPRRSNPPVRSDPTASKAAIRPAKQPKGGEASLRATSAASAPTTVPTTALASVSEPGYDSPPPVTVCCADLRRWSLKFWARNTRHYCCVCGYAFCSKCVVGTRRTQMVRSRALARAIFSTRRPKPCASRLTLLMMWRLMMLMRRRRRRRRRSFLLVLRNLPDADHLGPMAGCGQVAEKVATHVAHKRQSRPR
jgi:hypothetical protein